MPKNTERIYGGKSLLSHCHSSFKKHWASNEYMSVSWFKAKSKKLKSQSQNMESLLTTK